MVLTSSSNTVVDGVKSGEATTNKELVVSWISSL